MLGRERVTPRQICPHLLQQIFVLQQLIPSPEPRLGLGRLCGLLLKLLDDELYQQVRADFGKRSRWTLVRVLEGKKVASADKVLSLFEPHTRAIPRRLCGALVEFGRHVMLDEVEGGIVTRYEILEHTHEHGQAVEAVAHHVTLFDHPPAPWPEIGASTRPRGRPRSWR